MAPVEQFVTAIWMIDALDILMSLMDGAGIGKRTGSGIMNNGDGYGACPYCGAPLEASWFLDEEYKEGSSGIPEKTGRTRLAVDYLYCSCCLKRQCVDDSFDHPWSF